MGTMLTLNTDSAAIDAMILTKDRAIPEFSRAKQVPLARIAVIGDGTNDLPFLIDERYALIGAPANAKSEVRERVRQMRNGHVYEEEGIDAFFRFYDDARSRGATHIVSDKDGVLKIGDDERGDAFHERVGGRMGLDGPLVTVLTGSSLDQNLDFMAKYHFDQRLTQNRAVRDDPYLILAENGALHVNVLDPALTRNLAGEMDRAALGVLKGPFERAVLERAEREVLPAFGFAWSARYNDQRGKVYAPSRHLLIAGDRPKETMVTLNVPRRTAEGADFRKTPDAARFRDAVLQVMIDEAQRLGMPYHVL